MGQVTIYIDDMTEKKMMKMVEESGISKSKWITRLIRDKTETTWPDHIKALAGAWKDFPTLEQIRAGIGKDAHREPI